MCGAGHRPRGDARDVGRRLALRGRPWVGARVARRRLAERGTAVWQRPAMRGPAFHFVESVLAVAAAVERLVLRQGAARAVQEPGLPAFADELNKAVGLLRDPGQDAVLGRTV
jgi:hypothetical protein